MTTLLCRKKKKTMSPEKQNDKINQLISWSNWNKTYTKLDLNALLVARRLFINTQELKVRYLNLLYEVVGRNLPKNKSGQAVVSDYDLINASAEQHTEVFLKTLGIWESAPE